MGTINFSELDKHLNDVELTSKFGHISRVVGLIIESKGPEVSIGELCLIKNKGKDIKAEVVGFDKNKVLLMPIGDMEGINPGARVVATGDSLKLNVGNQLLGKVLNGVGQPLLESDDVMGNLTEVPVKTDPPNALMRQRITEPLSLGIRSIDGLLTCGRGQRIGIFSGSGVGKSTLMGM